MIPVHERQNLILAVGVQSQGQALWNIQATMIECQHVSLQWRDSVRSCPQGREDTSLEHVGQEEEARHTITVVDDGEDGDTREYNTSTGAMILVSSNNNQYYTWVGEREPRKVRGKVNVKTNTRKSENRRKKKRQREKKKGQGSPGTRMAPIHPVNDENMPVVKIMLANQVVCAGKSQTDNYCNVTSELQELLSTLAMFSPLPSVCQT